MSGSKSKFRLIPLTIFAAALMLSVKISDIVDGFGSVPDSLPIAQAVAQQAPPAPLTPPPPPSQDAVPAENAQPPENAPQEGTPPADEGNADTTALDDPSLLTQHEIDLLQQLAERREILESRARALDVRDGLLKAAEQRINRKLEEMRVLESTIQKLVKTRDDQQEAQVRSLVKIYENMKPKDAARIFEELDLDTLLLVAERMNERRLAPVMAQMNPEKAKEMTVELSRQRQLPNPGTPGG